MYKISDLYIYPVKSLRGIQVSSAEVSSRGFVNDRRWMLVDQHANFITQRQHARLSLVEASLEETGIRISAPEMQPLLLPYTHDEGDVQQVHIWKDTCNAVLGEQHMHDWFSSYLGVETRMVYMPDRTSRIVDPDFHLSERDIVSFADGFPFLLISEASLDDLNARLSDKGESPLSMRRFRPNIVVSGCHPYEEDEWKTFQVEDMLFSCVKPCSRCVVTTVDYTRGVTSSEPLRTLSEYRKKNNKVYFGMNLIHHFDEKNSNTLAVGQSLELMNTQA